MPCQVGVGEQSHAGLVLNVSQGGLFVQTSAASPEGDGVNLTLSPLDGCDAIPIRAQVVWRRLVPQQLRTSAQGGLGLRIEHADETYFQHLAEWMRLELGATRPAARLVVPGESPEFHVRVLAEGTRRSRRIALMAPSPEAAREVALASAGAGWRIIEVRDLR